MKIYFWVITISLIAHVYASTKEKLSDRYEERHVEILQYINSDEARFHELYLIALTFYQKLFEYKLSCDNSNYSRYSLNCYIAYLEDILKRIKLDEYYNDMISNKLEKLKILSKQFASNNKEFENAVYNTSHSLGIDSILIFGIGTALNTDEKIWDLQRELSKSNSSKMQMIESKITKRKLKIIQEEIIKTKEKINRSQSNAINLSFKKSIK